MFDCYFASYSGHFMCVDRHLHLHMFSSFLRSLFCSLHLIDRVDQRQHTMAKAIIDWRWRWQCLVFIFIDSDCHGSCRMITSSNFTHFIYYVRTQTAERRTPNGWTNICCSAFFLFLRFSHLTCSCFIGCKWLTWTWDMYAFVLFMLTCNNFHLLYTWRCAAPLKKQKSWAEWFFFFWQNERKKKTWSIH